MAVYDLATQSIDPSILVEGDSIVCSYCGSIKSITLNPAKYKLECWGAQGGIYSTSYANTGRGGYSVGILDLQDSATFYLSSGQCNTSTSSGASGWNGGGARKSYGGAGGGASDIRINSTSLYARVIVAGGSGGTGYSSANQGGHGGGLTGGTGANGSASGGTGGTQTSGGSVNVAGTFGQGASPASAGGAGGGGWYGGGSGISSSTDSAGGGGSGYVYTSDNAQYYPSGCLLNSEYYLTEASTYSGSSTFPSPSGSSELGHAGDGFVRITVLDMGFLLTYVTTYSSRQSKKVLAIDSKDIYPLDEPLNHRFDGWYYENSYTTRVQVGDKIVQDTTIYAKWIDCSTVNVMNILNGVINTNSSDKANLGGRYSGQILLSDSDKYFNCNLHKVIVNNSEDLTAYDESSHSLEITNIPGDIYNYIGSSFKTNLSDLGLFNPGASYNVCVKTGDIVSNSINYIGQVKNSLILYSFGDDRISESGGWLTGGGCGDVESSGHSCSWAYITTSNSINMSQYARGYALIKVTHGNGENLLHIIATRGTASSITDVHPSNRILDTWANVSQNTILISFWIPQETNQISIVAYDDTWITTAGYVQRQDTYYDMHAYSSSRTMNCYSVILVKNDDISGLSAYGSSISEILNNSSALLSSDSAVNYMADGCNGEFMMQAVNNGSFRAAYNANIAAGGQSEIRMSILSNHSIWGEGIKIMNQIGL